MDQPGAGQSAARGRRIWRLRSSLATFSMRRGALRRNSNAAAACISSAWAIVGLLTPLRRLAILRGRLEGICPRCPVHQCLDPSSCSSVSVPIAWGARVNLDKSLPLIVRDLHEPRCSDQCREIGVQGRVTFLFQLLYCLAALLYPVPEAAFTCSIPKDRGERREVSVRNADRQDARRSA